MILDNTNSKIHKYVVKLEKNPLFLKHILLFYLSVDTQVVMRSVEDSRSLFLSGFFNSCSFLGSVVFMASLEQD